MTASAVPNGQKIVITKTETEYNVKSLRFLLLTITFMFLAIACLMIVLGISVYSYYHDFSFFYESAKSGRFFTPSVMTVLLGMILLVVWSFGFFGTLKQSTCMVNTYAFFLTIILIIQLVVVILAFTMNPNTLMKYITIPIQEYPYDLEIQAEVDSLQVSLNCCGGESYLDYIGMEFGSNHSTVVMSKTIDGDLISLVIPETCCITKGDVFCAKMRETSCQSALINFVVQNASVLGVLGVSVMFIHLLGIIFALLLARCIRKLKSERELLKWKIKEQLILARNMEQADKDQTVFIVQSESSVA